MRHMKSCWNVRGIAIQAPVITLQSTRVWKINLYLSRLALVVEKALAEPPPLTIRILTVTVLPNQHNWLINLTYAVSTRTGQSKLLISSASILAVSKLTSSTCGVSLTCLASRTWRTKSLRVNTMTTRISSGSNGHEISRLHLTLWKRPVWETKS